MGNPTCWQRDGVNVGISEEVALSRGSLLWKALCSSPGIAACPSSAFPLFQPGSDKATTVSFRRRPVLVEGAHTPDFPLSHTSWCQTHFISSRLGTQGLPLQDYFLLRFVFQLEPPGAPLQGAAPPLWPTSFKGQWNASWETAGLGGGGTASQGMGALDGVPPLVFTLPAPSQ